MTFCAATQLTNLDRADNVRATVTAARRFRDETVTRSRALMTERELVTSAQAGDEAATLELVARHEPRIRAVVSEFRVANGAAEPDLHQSALEGFIAAIADYADDGRAELFTFAHSYIRGALRDANRSVSPVPVPSSQHTRFFDAMRAADNDPAVARRWSELQRLSIAALEFVAESGGQDEMLAREIIDHRVDVYERHVKRGYVGTGRGKGERKPVPSWDDYREQKGRGLTGHEFDTIHAAITYESLDVPRVDTSFRTGGGMGGDETDTYETVSEPEAPDPFTGVEDGVALAQVLTALDERERDIIGRFLDGDTDRATAEALGLSRPRVVNIRAGAIAKMRKLSAG